MKNANPVCRFAAQFFLRVCAVVGKKPLLLAGIALFAALPASAQTHYLLDDRQHVWQVQVMRTPAEHARGLMFRLYLPRDSGMLFVFDPPRAVNFWMLQTYIPLTMRFYDAYGNLIVRHAYAAPCYEASCPFYPSYAAVKYVLETRTSDRDTRVPYAFPRTHRHLQALMPRQTAPHHKK